MWAKPSLPGAAQLSRFITRPEPLSFSIAIQRDHGAATAASIFSSGASFHNALTLVGPKGSSRVLSVNAPIASAIRYDLYSAGKPKADPRRAAPHLPKKKEECHSP